MDIGSSTEWRENWYTNKEIFEMVQELRDEMSETRRVLHQYNDMQKDLAWAVECITQMQAAQHGRSSFQHGRSSFIIAMREWGGWLVALAILLLKLWD